MIIVSQDKHKIIAKFDSLVIDSYEGIETIKVITNNKELEIGVYYAAGKAQEILSEFANSILNEKAFKTESVYVMPANVYIEPTGKNEHYGYIECEIRKIASWGEIITLLKTDQKTAETLYRLYYKELCDPNCDIKALEKQALESMQQEDKQCQNK